MLAGGYGWGEHLVSAEGELRGHVLRGKWVISVLAALALGKLPYTELLATVNTAERRPGSRHDPLSDRVFTDTLERGVKHGLMTKHGDPQSYELTPKGRALLRAVRPLVGWAQDHDSDNAVRAG